MPTEPFDAVLAEAEGLALSCVMEVQLDVEHYTEILDRLSAAHNEELRSAAAELAERDARIAELDSECRQHLLRALENGQAALAAEHCPKCNFTMSGIKHCVNCDQPEARGVEGK